MSKRMVEQDCCDIGECSQPRVGPCHVCHVGDCETDLCSIHGHHVCLDLDCEASPSLQVATKANLWLCPWHFAELRARYVEETP